MPGHLETGIWGEKVAAGFLSDKGYRILGTRVRVGSRDELDLIARDGKVLVFIEVKTRRHEHYGRPFSAVNQNKRRTLSRAAIRYVQRLRNPRICFRFDVVEVVGAPDSGRMPDVRHIENAFVLNRRYMLP